MNNSYGKSPQIGFSRCKLSPLFHSSFSPALEQKLSFADFIDTKLIQSGRMLNKIGKIERPDMNMITRLSDLNTSQKRFIAGSSQNDQDSGLLLGSEGNNAIFTGNSMSKITPAPEEDIRCPVPRYKFKSNLHNKSNLKNTTTFEPSEYLSAFTVKNVGSLSSIPKTEVKSSNPNNTDNTGNSLSVIQSSILRQTNSNVQLGNLPNGITIINNNNVTINNYPQPDSFIGLKRQRIGHGIPQNEKKNSTSTTVPPVLIHDSVINYSNSKSCSDSQDQEQVSLVKKNFKIKQIKMKKSVGHHSATSKNSQMEPISNEININDNTKQALDIPEEAIFKVEGNKMTKKILEENLSVHVEVPPNDKKRHKEKKMKKFHANEYNIQLEDTNDKNISIFYQYLLERFEDTPDPSCSLDNEIVKTQYLKYHDNPQPNQLKLNFGENPLTFFQDYASWLKEEQKKEQNDKTKEMCEEIAKTLNNISCSMSKIPILICPRQSCQKDSQLIKKKKKKIFKQQRPNKSNSSNQKEKISNEEKKFKCDFCPESFATGQGLGGHMSRKHKDKSEKFKKKKEIRNSREHLRKLLMDAKKILCERHMIDFEEQMKTKQGKQLIKDVIFECADEYKKIRIEIRKRKMGLLKNNVSEKKK